MIGARVLNVSARRVSRSGASTDQVLFKVEDVTNAVMAQRYSGDITILPRHSPRQLLRLFSNLDARELTRFIGEGERATWPRIARIRNQTAISRAFETCLLTLKQARADGQPRRRRPRPAVLPLTSP